MRQPERSASKSNQGPGSLRRSKRRRLTDDDLVAIKPDIDLQMLGWTRDRIKNHRRFLARRRPRNKQPWLPAEDKRLGKIPDATLVRQLGRSTKAVKARRQALWIRVTPVLRPEDDKILVLVGDRRYHGLGLFVPAVQRVIDR